VTTMTAAVTSEQRRRSYAPEIGGIVVGFDGSPASYSAVQPAGEIAAISGWPVHVVSVLPPSSSYEFKPMVDESPSEIEDLRVQIRDAALRDVIGDQDDRSRWTRQVIIGNPADEIARVAEELGAHLIVLGGNQRRTVVRPNARGTTMEVMRRSSVPVRCVAYDSPHVLQS
jgi:nucleotide-binding universal stress UspA family protein